MSSARFQSLPEWLRWQESLHFTAVDPGLARIGQVWQTINQGAVLPFTIITVAGTNGKGSSVALLESILRTAGYKTGTYTSPHILRYNERICINNNPCSDEDICNIFNEIDTVREDISLTYFEFATLAAIELFKVHKVDIVILEVGMGGRLDAVNLFDTDIALITPISLDHVSWLGDTRELIGAEKAGILRQNKAVICSEESPPDSVLSRAQDLNSPVYKAGTEFRYTISKNNWQWSNSDNEWNKLAMPALEGDYQFQNSAAILQVISLLIEQGYNISQSQINTGLSSVKLMGRFQRIASDDVEVILDVTHNEQGAQNLAKLLAEYPIEGQTFAVLGMLKDKDAVTVGKILEPAIAQWNVGTLTGDRGMSSKQLSDQLSQHVEADKINQFESLESAYKHTLEQAKKSDRVIVFGSFHTIEAILRTNLLNR